jgi:hypothetical protein
VSVKYKLGTRKAVQVDEVDSVVFEPDSDFKPDYGVIKGTDGISYALLLSDNPKPPQLKEMLILELIGMGENYMAQGCTPNDQMWTIVRGEK